MSKSRRWPIILAVIVALIAVFIFTAPASLLKDPVKDANLPVQLTGYQGRLLSGTVQSVFVKGVNFNNLSWQLNPIAALSAELSAFLTIDDPEADLGIDLRFKDQTKWQFSELNGRLGLSKITKLSQILGMVKPGGNIVFRDVASALQSNTFSGTQGQLDWQSANLNINGQTLSLGLIEGELSDDGDFLYLDFTGQESIQPSGQIKIEPVGRFEVNFNLNPDYLPANMSWLNSMGKLNAEGRLTFTFKGQL